MIMKMLFKNIISISVKNIFQMLPLQNMLRYLPRRNQKRLVEYRLNVLVSTGGMPNARPQHELVRDLVEYRLKVPPLSPSPLPLDPGTQPLYT